jgi:hypothetical protein
MRITGFNAKALAETPYLNAGRRPHEILEERLPVFEASVDHLPEGIDALVATADLQFRERPNGKQRLGLRLLGETLPQWLADEVLPPLGVHDPRRAGVLLCGDFYTVPALDRRGGSGDVTEVWRAFRDVFGWVAGVAGNHDSFGPDAAARPRFSHKGGLFYLDGEAIELPGLRIAGIGGIIGDPRKLQRRTEEDYLNALAMLLDRRPDVLLCHDGAEGLEHGQRGSPAVRELIELYPPTLVVRGHAHWHAPLAELSNGTQILNVDSRVVVLRA